MYLGATNFLVVDQGTVQSSMKMKEYFEVYDLELDEAPIGTPGAIVVVKGCHIPLWLAYGKIRADTERKTSEQKCLYIEVFVINCTFGPKACV